MSLEQIYFFQQSSTVFRKFMSVPFHSVVSACCQRSTIIGGGVVFCLRYVGIWKPAFHCFSYNGACWCIMYSQIGVAACIWKLKVLHKILVVWCAVVCRKNNCGQFVLNVKACLWRSTSCGLKTGISVLLSLVAVLKLVPKWVSEWGISLPVQEHPLQLEPQQLARLCPWWESWLSNHWSGLLMEVRISLAHFLSHNCGGGVFLVEAESTAWHIVTGDLGICGGPGMANGFWMVM